MYNNNSSLGKDKNDIYMTFGNDSIINSTKQEENSKNRKKYNI